MAETKKPEKERYKVTRDDVELARGTQNGLMEIEEEHGKGAACAVLRVLERNGMTDGQIIDRILECSSAEPLLIAYAKRRMKSKWWRAFVDTVIDFDASKWFTIGQAARNAKLLPIVCTDEGLEYLWKTRRAAITNPTHPFFDVISFDAYYRRTVLHFLEQNDDGRAWRELVRACQGLPWSNHADIREKRKVSYRCYRASKTTLIVLISRIFDDLVTRNRIGEIRAHERCTPKLPPDLEPLIVGAINGTYDRHDVFHYEDAAVMAMKLDEYYRKRRATAHRRNRAKAAPKSRRAAQAKVKRAHHHAASAP